MDEAAAEAVVDEMTAALEDGVVDAGEEMNLEEMLEDMGVDEHVAEEVVDHIEDADVTEIQVGMSVD